MYLFEIQSISTDGLGTAHQSNLYEPSSFFPDCPSEKATYVLSLDWNTPKLFTFRHCLIRWWRNCSPCLACKISGDSIGHALLWPEALGLVLWVTFCVQNKPKTSVHTENSPGFSCFSRKFKSNSPHQQGFSFIGVVYWNNCRIYSYKHLQWCK